MTDEPDEWDLTPAPLAVHRARVRETLLSYCDADLAPMLSLVDEITGDRSLVAETLMAVAKIYKDDTYGWMGESLARARLAKDLETDREQAAQEAS